MQTNGLTHIYCGDGKGKTTAALGLALRWAGYGRFVLFVQFQKTEHSGELDTLRLLPTVEILRVQDGLTGFSWQFNEEETARRTQSHNQLLQQAFQICQDEKRRLLVLDELTSAMNCGLIDSAAVMQYIRTKPKDVELVITGREPTEELCKIADYISKIHVIKHPIHRGISAREGVEY